MMLGGWPFRLHFYPSELLSSYLVRSAHAHGTPPYIFCSLFWPKRAIWNRDLDRDPDRLWLEDLSSKTGVALVELEGSCLRDYRQKLSESHLKNGDTPLLLSASVYHTTRRLHALQYCAECLREEPAYFRKLWRLGFVLWCETHRVPLLDACPHCDAPIIPHKAQLRRLQTCYRCTNSLCSDAEHSESIPKAVIKLQQRLLNDLKQATRSDDFHIVRALISVSTSRVVQTALRTCFSLSQRLLTSSDLQFEYARNTDRVKLLETVAHWISEWPTSFLDGSRASGLTQKTFIRIDLPTDLRIEVLKLPVGATRRHEYVPILNTPEMRRLKRKDPSAYRTARAQKLLKVAGR